MKNISDLGKELSREEAKKIKGGVEELPEFCGSGPCTVFNSTTGRTHSGNCGWYDKGMPYEICECKTDLGRYDPQNGTSACYIA